MDAEFALNVFDKAPYVTVSFILPDGSPYGVPLTVVRTDEEHFYFHCASEGLKMEALMNSPEVFMSAVSFCKPTMGPDSNFTLQYHSAMASGKARVVTLKDEKIRALKAICERFLPQHMDQFPIAIERSLENTTVVCITLLNPPIGKRKQYDSQGKELKYGRME